LQDKYLTKNQKTFESNDSGPLNYNQPSSAPLSDGAMSSSDEDVNVDELERLLLAAHSRQPENLVPINHLIYLYSIYKPDQRKADYFENLFKKIVDEKCRLLNV